MHRKSVYVAVSAYPRKRVIILVLFGSFYQRLHCFYAHTRWKGKITRRGWSQKWNHITGTLYFTMKKLSILNFWVKPEINTTKRKLRQLCRMTSGNSNIRICLSD